jgi:hypothetical protein
MAGLNDIADLRLQIASAALKCHRQAYDNQTGLLDLH